jgi:hypothetical protein
MVEAAAVIPLLVLFYGILVFVFREYDLKASLMASSQAEALRGTLHQCRAEDTETQRAHHELWRAPSNARWSQQPRVGRVLDIAGMRTSMEARGMKSVARSEGKATNSPLSQMVRERLLVAESQVYCVPLGLGENNDYQPLAKSTTRAIVDDVIAAALRALREIFDRKLITK